MTIAELSLNMITIYAYEPKQEECYADTIMFNIRRKLLPFLGQWFQDWNAQAGTTHAIPPTQIKSLSRPQQKDGFSCGVHVLGQIYSVIHGGYGLTAASLSAEYVILMRLRILWKLICDSAKRDPSQDDSFERIQASLGVWQTLACDRESD